ncbi:sensor domain-containing protein [Dermatobacter hominis]|uniref:sensor domain-containing protein n=1 Tax=Dermatobacter hominis TaxID=2884263 RepID=UPI001D108D00|nr:EAL domain-containing protein [Dermatobacter hominis]UDY37596.1 EAL domain-containing protein [Dermatobacter hominis]
MSGPETSPSNDLLIDRRLHLVLDASVDALLVLGPGGTVVSASPSTERLLGRSITELKAIHPLDLVHPDDLPEAARLLERLVDGIEEDAAPILRVEVAGEGYVWVEIKGSDLTDVPGIGGVVLAARDVSRRVELEEAVRSSHRRFESLLRNSNDGIVVLDEQLELTYASPSIERLSGFPPEAMIGYDVSVVVLEPQRTELLAALQRVVADPDLIESLRVQIRHRTSGRRWLEVRVSNQLHDPAIAGVIANLRDVTDVVHAEAEAARLTEIFDLTADLVTVVDGEARLQYMNPACARFFAIPPDEVPIGSVWQVAQMLPAAGEPCAFDGGDRIWRTEVVLDRHDGLTVPFAVQVIAHHDDDGTISRYSAVAHDISQSKRLEASLEHQALHDPLTGLPNRALLEDRMRSVRRRSVSPSAPMSLLFVDLDHFKVINDSLGHGFGDRLLRAVADRLRGVVRGEDTIARFGGDEFVILCEGPGAAATARVVARRISEVLVEPVVVDGSPVHVSVSIGVADAAASADDDDPGALIRDADTAMYRAKAGGRGRAVVFDDELRRRAVERQRIESALRDAPTDGSLVLHYQPMVDLATGSLRGVEALVRWQHGGELLGPGEFVPIAEETDLILPLGEWVLQAACLDLARWQRLPGWDGLGLSVNVSVRQLQHGGFVDVVQDVLRTTGVRARTLSLEITESVLLDDSAMDPRSAARLRELGVDLAIDDFGTGYSSLTYLARLPVDVVKLDRTFLEAAGSDAVRNRVVGGVVDLVKALGLRCVAEGIESAEQYQLLADLGCDAAQGFHIDRPMPAERLTEHLVANGPTERWPSLRGLASVDGS